MNAATLAFGILFTTWLALTVVVQFHYERINFFRRFDVLNLLPTWTFFAPNPGSTDYHIIFRNRFESGEVTAWRDALPIPKQNAICAVWNPQKRHVKVVGDAVSSILEAYATARSKGQSKESIESALIFFGPYLVILNLVLQSAGHPPKTVSLQFAIVERTSFGREAPPRPILLSQFHRIR